MTGLSPPNGPGYQSEGLNSPFYRVLQTQNLAEADALAIEFQALFFFP